MYFIYTFFLYLYIIKKIIYADVTTLLKANQITCVVNGTTTRYPIYLKNLNENASLQQNILDPLFNRTYWIKREIKNNEWNNVSYYLGVVTDKRWQDFESEFGNNITFNLTTNVGKVGYGFSTCAKVNMTISNVEKNMSHKNNYYGNNVTCENWFHYRLRVRKVKNRSLKAYIFDSNLKYVASKKIYYKKNTFLEIQIKTLFNIVWKKHILTFQESNKLLKKISAVDIQFNGKLCISMFVFLNENSKLLINLQSNETRENKTIQGEKDSRTWKEIKLEIESKNQTLLTFSRKKINNNKPGYWAVDDIKHCSSNLAVYQATLRNPNNSSKDVLCSSLNKSLDNMSENIVSLKHCNTGYFGINCEINCADIFNNSPYCENYKICDEGGTCYCAWGYQGPYCDKVCHEGFWGLNCTMQCKDACEKCDHLTGECKKYFGNQSSEILPTSTKTPLVTNISDRKYVVYFLKATSTAVAIMLLIFTIIFLSYIPYAYVARKYPFDLRKKRMFEPEYPEMIELATENQELSNHYKTTHIKTCRDKLELPPEDEEMRLLTAASKSSSKPIKMEDYESYLRSCLVMESDELLTQFKKVPKKSAPLCTSGLTAENHQKNRYKNLIPYETTRVILNNVNNGDYINANYVDGYQAPKGFIATQAPLPSTVCDFWWMVWQENVSAIIMLTALKEEDLVSSVQYWSDLDSSIVAGKIKIKTIFIKMSPDYKHRKFELEFEKNKRVIDHLQYTTWPDHSVPLYPQSFTSFMKIILRMRPQTNSPLVVHCNAGCGRTGTLILCDIVLRMVAKEKTVDFLKVLAEMRHQRPALVNNVDQYIFAHVVVYDCLFGQDFSIPINDNFQNEVETVLRKATVKPLMEYLDKVKIQVPKKVKYKPALSEEDKKKNRFSSALPGDTQIILSTCKNGSNYINAVSVDCYRRTKKFIVTQQPLSHTVDDFWTMVQEFDINTIVSLNEFDENDLDCPKFWPCDTTMNINNDTSLHFVNETESKHYNIIEIKMSQKTKINNNRIVNIINMKNWKRQMAKPMDVKDIILVLEEIFIRARKSDSPIIVSCYDGFTASGLFTALAYLLEKIKVEHIFDVFSAVRTVRDSRPEFVQDWFEFLYKAAVVYVEEFGEYHKLRI